MLWRIGQFLLFSGVLILIVFFITDQVDSPNYWYFCSGVLVTLIGGFYMWNGRKPPEKADRFRIFRRRSAGKKKR